MTVTFVVHGIPRPKGSMFAFVPKWKSRPIMIPDKGSKEPAWRKDVAKLARAAMGPLDPFVGPIEMRITYYIPKPAKVPADRDGWPCVFPDIDKMERSILDACTLARVWHDDGQVVHVDHRKVYAGGKHDIPEGTPRVEVVIHPLTDTRTSFRE